MTNYHRQMIPATLDIDMLRCFLAVAQYGGFTRAGEEIGLTQSGVSIKIKRLEERLETAVFQRTSKSLALTPAGEILKGYAQRILKTHDEVVQRLSAPGKTGSLKVGMADYFIPNILPSLLSRFRQHYPNIHIQITAGLGSTLIPLFDLGKLDLVVAGLTEHPNVERRIVKDPLIWVTGKGHSLSEGEPIPLVLLPSPCGFRNIAIETLETAGIPWEIVFTGTSVTSIQAAVQAGLGISILPTGALTSFLQRLPISTGLPELPIHTLAVFTDKNVENHAKNIFIDYLELELTKLPDRFENE